MSERREFEAHTLTTATMPSVKLGLLKALSCLSNGPGGAAGGRSETPQAMTTIMMLGTMAQMPAQPSHEICLNVRADAPIPMMMAATTANTTVQVPCSDMALKEILEARIPDEARKIMNSCESEAQVRT